MHANVCCADAMDVYVSTKCVVRLLDFNPYGWTTQPLLFTYIELDDLSRARTQRASSLTASPERVPCANGSVADAQAHSHPSGDNALGGHSAETQSGSDGAELRMVESPLHIQVGSAVACGAPADVHLHLQGQSWPAVMDMLREQSLGASAD